MKTTVINKILSILAVFFFCLTTFTAGAANIIPAGTELYLKPNSNWKADGARFAAYFFTDNVGSEWVSMTDCDGDGIYEVNSPNKEYAKVIFCRMNPANTTNNWDKNSNFWNQTANLTYDGTNNTYTVEDGTWDKGGGTWSSYTQDYYIAGNGTAGNPWCNGNDWGANFADNKLQGTGDTKTITFEKVPPGVYKYKITRGSWNCDSWGYNGGDLTLELAQWSDVTVSFNVSTKYIETEANEVKDLMTVYLDPKVEGGGDWMVNNEARIAVYLFNSTDNTKYGWVSAKKDDNGLYYAQFPAAYDTYIWCRMKGDNGDNNWENRWNQTDNITFDADKPLTKLTTFGDGYAKSYQMINCTFPPIEEEFPVMVRINQFVESDPCNYLFKSFEEAWEVLKQNKALCTVNGDAVTLQHPVEMLVTNGDKAYKGATAVEHTGGHVPTKVIMFKDINPNGGEPLVITTADPRGNRAVLVHPVVRNCRNITFDRLDIVGDKETKDNAMDIGVDMSGTAHSMENMALIPRPDDAEPSNITIQNCKVESWGRNALHIVGAKGLHIENNDFFTHYDYSGSTDENEWAVDWAGTIKFVNSTDIKFLRNSSDGTLATSLFIQGCKRILVMNNVFWNENSVAVKNVHETGHTVANVRLVSFGTKAADFKLQNIGIYYNTFFIKDNTVGDGSYDYFDFFRLGGKEQPVLGSIIDNFDPKTIRFQYNNCYSYDDDIRGNNDKTNIEEYAEEHPISDDIKTLLFYLQGIGESTDWCQCFQYNNFWSIYDKNNEYQSSKFEIGKFCVENFETYNLFENVEEVTCTTDPSRPGSLVVVGDGLNIGMQIKKDDDVSLQGADKIFNDRLNPLNEGNTVRPRYPVEVDNESLSPYDKIHTEPGIINLYTSKIIGSQTTDVLLTSIDIKAQMVSLTLVDAKGEPFDNDPIVFALTDSEGNQISSEEVPLKNTPIYITFVRPANPTDNMDYEAFLKIIPAGKGVTVDEEQLVLLIPIHGHYYHELNKIPGAWTVGAFQQGTVTPVNTIIWHGTVSSIWDDRNNWYKEDGTLVTCLDALTEDLRVIIPNKNSEKYITPPDGISRYPLLPNVSSEEYVKERNQKWGKEAVNAGSNFDEKNPKLAHTIDMEYGAAIVGVENITDKNYAEVKTEFTARRHDWLLVGGVVNPFKVDEEGNLEKDSEGNLVTRPMVSGDYYLGHLPHVYMHSANINENSVGWDESFAPLDVEVDPKRVFAVRLPNQYGPKKWPAVVYNRKNGLEGKDQYDGDAPYTYQYTGRFYNQGKVLAYEKLEPGKPVLLTNTYPANINAAEFQKEKGTIQIYDYDNKEFRAVAPDEKDAEILSQHGFLFTVGVDRDRLQVDQNFFNYTATGHRSAADEVYSFRIKTTNYKESVSSEVYISFDELKEDVANYFTDAPKVFNGKQTALAELYVMRYDKKWAGISIPEMTKPIPLGVKVASNDQKFIFSLAKSNLPYEIFLEDRQEGKTYNLSAGERCVVEDLVAGNCEGRFYINLQEIVVEDEEEDVPTDVEEATSSNPAIDIFTNENTLVVSANSEVELQTIIVSDMSGKHQVYNVSGQYVVLSLPVSTGVYTVNVVGDTASVIEKVKLN